jgi:hypothetical protein
MKKLIVTGMFVAALVTGGRWLSSLDQPSTTVRAAETATSTTAPVAAPEPTAPVPQRQATATTVQARTQTPAAPVTTTPRAAAPTVSTTTTTVAARPEPTTTSTTSTTVASGPPSCTVSLDRSSAKVGETINATVTTNVLNDSLVFGVSPGRSWKGSTGSGTYRTSFPVQDGDTGTVTAIIHYVPNDPPKARCQAFYTVG